jgi:hypothetical protein
MEALFTGCLERVSFIWFQGPMVQFQGRTRTCVRKSAAKTCQVWREGIRGITAARESLPEPGDMMKSTGYECLLKTLPK